MAKYIKCEKESEQMIVYSINFSVGKKEDNEKLMQHQQVCPHCNHTTQMIYAELKQNK
ncbi:MAG: hypothetical protein PHU94_03270 [Bacilli bacterium]|nr:hypothetical protein [Bacilli bacterium]MDD4734100.1 hypothetical protein [Bacilli bacterium]